jgi:hypothetical protein
VVVDHLEHLLPVSTSTGTAAISVACHSCLS